MEATGNTNLSFKVSSSVVNTWASCCAHLAHRQVCIQFQSMLQSLMQKCKQSLSTEQDTQDIINIWSGFHQSWMCALQLYCKQTFLGTHKSLGVCSRKTLLRWELQLWERGFFVSFVHDGSMLLRCMSSSFNKEGTGEIPPFANWIPILHYITLILLSAHQQDGGGRYLALFLSHHHSVMVDLAGWNEDFHLWLPLMSLSEASNSHAPCGCSGLVFREGKTSFFWTENWIRSEAASSLSSDEGGNLWFSAELSGQEIA